MSNIQYEKFLQNLACFNCEYKEDCEDGFEHGHTHCDEKYKEAVHFMNNNKTITERTTYMTSKRELETIQKHEKLNTVYAIDEPDASGANHLYRIEANGLENGEFALIQFQQGARKMPDSIHGIIDTDLLEIVRDRLKGFQSGKFACEYNEVALIYVEAALACLNQRVEERINRNVLGTDNK